jgi:hypothetical protein
MPTFSSVSLTYASSPGAIQMILFFFRELDRIIFIQLGSHLIDLFSRTFCSFSLTASESIADASPNKSCSISSGGL